MKRKICGLAVVLAFFWGSNLARADAEFYVIAGGGGVGTRIHSLPYDISKAGFYYIASNLSSSGNGINVYADNVTIDLMGFMIRNLNQVPSGYGIYMMGRTGVEIRNGIIANFAWGIYEGDKTNGGNHRILNVRANRNGSYGMVLTGNNHIVKNCTASNNNGTGIAIGNQSLAMGNVANDNGFYGINAINNALIGNNVAVGNGTANISYTTGTAFENRAP